jgi:hypothetical protein
MIQLQHNQRFKPAGKAVVHGALRVVGPRFHYENFSTS